MSELLRSCNGSEAAYDSDAKSIRIPSLRSESDARFASHSNTAKHPYQSLFAKIDHAIDNSKQLNHQQRSRRSLTFLADSISEVHQESTTPSVNVRGTFSTPQRSAVVVPERHSSKKDTSVVDDYLSRMDSNELLRKNLPCEGMNNCEADPGPTSFSGNIEVCTNTSQMEQQSLESSVLDTEEQKLAVLEATKDDEKSAAESSNLVPIFSDVSLPLSEKSLHLFNMHISQKLGSQSTTAMLSPVNSVVGSPRSLSPSSIHGNAIFDAFPTYNRSRGVKTEHNRKPSDPLTRRLFEQADSSNTLPTRTKLSPTRNESALHTVHDDASSVYLSHNVSPSSVCRGSVTGRNTFLRNPNSLAIGGRAASGEFPLSSPSDGCWFSSLKDRNPWSEEVLSQQQDQAVVEAQISSPAEEKRSVEEREATGEALDPSPLQKTATGVWQRAIKAAGKDPSPGGLLAASKFDREGRMKPSHQKLVKKLKRASSTSLPSGKRGARRFTDRQKSGRVEEKHATDSEHTGSDVLQSVEPAKVVRLKLKQSSRSLTEIKKRVSGTLGRRSRDRIRERESLKNAFGIWGAFPNHRDVQLDFSQRDGQICPSRNPLSTSAALGDEVMQESELKRRFSTTFPDSMKCRDSPRHKFATVPGWIDRKKTRSGDLLFDQSCTNEAKRERSRLHQLLPSTGARTAGLFAHPGRQGSIGLKKEISTQQQDTKTWQDGSCVSGSTARKLPSADNDITESTSTIRRAAGFENSNNSIPSQWDADKNPEPLFDKFDGPSRINLHELSEFKSEQSIWDPVLYSSSCTNDTQHTLGLSSGLRLSTVDFNSKIQKETNKIRENVLKRAQVSETERSDGDVFVTPMSSFEEGQKE